ARRVDIAEHFGDAADRAARRSRPTRQFDLHHLARRCAALLSRRNEDVHEHAAIERHDVTHGALVAIVPADERFVRAFEDTNDAPFGPATLLDALDADDDAIAVHRFVEQRTGNVNVAAERLKRTIRRHEAVAGG